MDMWQGNTLSRVGTCCTGVCVSPCSPSGTVCPPERWGHRAPAGSEGGSDALGCCRSHRRCLWTWTSAWGREGNTKCLRLKINSDLLSVLGSLERCYINSSYYYYNKALSNFEFISLDSGDCGSGGREGRPQTRGSVVRSLQSEVLSVLGQDTDPKLPLIALWLIWLEKLHISTVGFQFKDGGICFKLLKFIRECKKTKYLIGTETQQ